MRGAELVVESWSLGVGDFVNEIAAARTRRGMKKEVCDCILLRPGDKRLVSRMTVSIQTPQGPVLTNCRLLRWYLDLVLIMDSYAGVRLLALYVNGKHWVAEMEEPSVAHS